MTPHGPDAATFEAAVGVAGAAAQGPAHLPPDTLAFMFETNWTPRVTMSVRRVSSHQSRSFESRQLPGFHVHHPRVPVDHGDSMTTSLSGVHLLDTSHRA